MKLLLLLLFAQLPPVPLTDVLSPVSFGAVANDGQDDAPAFVAMTEQLKDGGTIELPPGTFDLTTDDCPMRILKDHVTIRGA